MPARERTVLTVFQLSAYPHELNPVEPLWPYLNRSLANLAKRNLTQLTALVKTRLKPMQYTRRDRPRTEFGQFKGIAAGGGRSRVRTWVG